MGAITTVKVDMTGLKRIQGELDPRAQLVIKKTAFDIENRARRRAPVDTGALRASIYSSIGGGPSTYGTSKAIAKGMNPETKFTDEVKAEGLSANIGASVEYAIHQEFGTRKMGAHPFLIPSLEEVRKAFLAAWKELTK